MCCNFSSIGAGLGRREIKLMPLRPQFFKGIKHAWIDLGIVHPTGLIMHAIGVKDRLRVADA